MKKRIAVLRRCPFVVLAFLSAMTLLGFLSGCATQHHSSDDHVATPDGDNDDSTSTDDDAAPDEDDDDNDDNDDDSIPTDDDYDLPDDVFVVGDSGTILHFDGSDWTTMDSRTTADLGNVSGSSPVDVYAIGSGANGGSTDILHFDGAKWSSLSSFPAYGQPSGGALWAAAANDLYVGGTDYANGQLAQFVIAVVWRYDGKRWSTVWADGPVLLPVLTFGGSFFTYLWGDSSRNVYAVGNWSYQDFANRYSGNLGAHTVDSVWRQWPPGAGNETISGLWGTSATDIYSVGFNDQVLKCDGTGWTTVYAAGNGSFGYLWGTSSTDIWAAGATADNEGGLVHFDGSTWTPTTIADVNWLGPLWGSSPSDYFAIGSVGTQLPLVGYVYHFNGSQWFPMNIGTNVELAGIWGHAHQSLNSIK